MSTKSATCPRNLMSRRRSEETFTILALMFSNRTRRCVAEGTQPGNDGVPSFTLLPFASASGSTSLNCRLPLPAAAPSFTMPYRLPLPVRGGLLVLSLSSLPLSLHVCKVT